MPNEYFVSSGGQLVSSRVGTCLIQATGSSKSGIADVDWKEYVQYANRVGHEGPIVTALQYSPDVAPTAKQRAELKGVSESFTRHLRGVAICTDSMMVRGVITAIHWLMKSQNQCKAFKSSEHRAALLWLQSFGELDLVVAQATLEKFTKQVGHTLT